MSEYQIVEPEAEDLSEILNIAERVGVFVAEEIDTVNELFTEYLRDGPESSGYQFVAYKDASKVLGFACFGPRALTDGTYDLYWIAVDKATQGMGVGKALIQHVERDIANLGGRLIVVETSGHDGYEPTRRFYTAVGYELEARLRDFYKPGDDLVIFTKHLK